MSASVTYYNACCPTSSFSFEVDVYALRGESDVQDKLVEVCKHKRTLNDVPYKTVEEYRETYHAYQELQSVVEGLLRSHPRLQAWHESVKQQYGLMY